MHSQQFFQESSFSFVFGAPSNPSLDLKQTSLTAYNISLAAKNASFNFKQNMGPCNALFRNRATSSQVLFVLKSLRRRKSLRCVAQDPRQKPYQGVLRVISGPFIKA